MRANEELKRVKCSAKGVCYQGVAATGRRGPESPTLTLVAVDQAALTLLWDEIMGPLELNPAGIYAVALFQQRDVTEQG